MAHRLAALTNYPYMKLLNKSYRCNSSYCGVDYPTYPPPPCGSDCDVDEPPMGTMYHCRKYSHGLPGYQCITLPFESVYFLPCDVFRNTDGEELGPGAGKCRVYKNPEYYAYHHNTYYDMQLLLRMFRKPSAISGRKPTMNTYNKI